MPCVSEWSVAHMITVADILALPSFENVSLVADCPGWEDRTVRNVGIVDCPPDYNEYGVYMPGELILTNMGFAYDDAALAERSLLALIKRGVSAIAVKRVYNAPISEKVKETSRVEGIPIFQYDGAYHERVAYESLELIKRDQEDADHAQAIGRLLDDHDADAVKNELHELMGATGASIQCFALAPRGRDALSLYAARDTALFALKSVKREHPVVDSFGACRYGGLILAFVCYAETGTVVVDEARYRCEDLIACEGNLVCGEGMVQPLGEGDLSIRQAMAALEYARLDSERVVCWKDMGFAAFCEAARQDRLFLSVSLAYRKLLTAYDEEHGGELMRTAESLYRTSGDIKETAVLLFQHPNTIRYRIRKMKSLFGMEEELDKSFLTLLFLVFMPSQGRGF